MAPRPIASLLANLPRPYRTGNEVAQAMRTLMAKGVAELPLPGSGGTLSRWQALAAVGALDLCLAKIYEGHTDAVAILAELNGPSLRGLGAVWASEPPQARVEWRTGQLYGLKAWCSGARIVDQALLTCWSEAGAPLLALCSLREPGITISGTHWQALGMAASESLQVSFDGVPATLVGKPGAYLARPGFWQGGGGIAAVWYGAATAIAQKLAASSKAAAEPHAAAHLGAVEVALQSAGALLREGAAFIDAHPIADASAVALRLRAGVEAAAEEVMRRTGHALGPGPLCMDLEHAQRCADLGVFLRQSHAERDLEALGRLVAAESSGWPL